jgi:hypothetical protein
MTARKLMITVCVVALLAACGRDSTGPSRLIVGTYTLTTISGQTLPYTFLQVDEDNRIDVLAGAIILNADGTFSDQTELRFVVDGEAEVELDDAVGTYTLTANALTFSTSDGRVYTAVLDTGTGTITQNVQGQVFVYRR